MVLFDESPVTLIHETTTQFHITPDKDSLSRIHNSLHTLRSTRAQNLQAQKTALTALSRRLHNSQAQRRFEEERYDGGKHAAEVLRLDTEKFRVAKGVSEGEIEGERLEGELGALRGVLEGLEREGVEGGSRGSREEGGREGDVLKLQVYRSLGIEATHDQTSGDFTQAVVRNPAKGDVNVLDLEARKLRQGAYADEIWENL
ncbi:hypothetical protein MBLNU230_g6317t1 [Neophaeotheca triangularis]